MYIIITDCWLVLLQQKKISAFSLLNSEGNGTISTGKYSVKINHCSSLYQTTTTFISTPSAQPTTQQGDMQEICAPPGLCRTAAKGQINKHDLSKIVEDAAAGSAKSLEDRPALENCQVVQGRSSQPCGLHHKAKDLTELLQTIVLHDLEVLLFNLGTIWLGSHICASPSGLFLDRLGYASYL